MSIFARRVRDPSGNSPAFIRATPSNECSDHWIDSPNLPTPNRPRLPTTDRALSALEEHDVLVERITRHRQRIGRKVRIGVPDRDAAQHTHVRTDAERGRIYLPQAELARFKVSEAEILRFEYSPQFRELAVSVRDVVAAAAG